VSKFVRAYAEGVHYSKTQRAFSVQVMSKYMRNNDLALVNDLYELYLIQNMLRIPRPSPQAVKTVLDQIAETDSRAANLRPEQFIDSRFFQEMEKDGFLQRLWK
jgi:predicted solute-binding protein